MVMVVMVVPTSCQPHTTAVPTAVGVTAGAAGMEMTVIGTAMTDTGTAMTEAGTDMEMMANGTERATGTVNGTVMGTGTDTGMMDIGTVMMANGMVMVIGMVMVTDIGRILWFHLGLSVDELDLSNKYMCKYVTHCFVYVYCVNVLINANCIKVPKIKISGFIHHVQYHVLKRTFNFFYMLSLL